MHGDMCDAVSALGSPAGGRGGGGRIATAARMRDAAILPPPEGARGYEAESRRERWSPEPGHLMGGALGDEGGRRATGRPEADGGQAPAKGSHPGCSCGTADGSREPIPA